MGYGGTRRKTVGFAFSASRIAFLLAGYLEKMRAAHRPALRPHGRTNPSLPRVFLFSTGIYTRCVGHARPMTISAGLYAGKTPNVAECDSLAYELSEQGQD